MNIVTRFAPSPTGFFLHIDVARTSLFNWLTALHYVGKFVFTH